MLDNGLSSSAMDQNESYDQSSYIAAQDQGLAAIQLGARTDEICVDKIKKIKAELEEINRTLRKFGSLKREIEAKNDGKSEDYDITELHEKLIEFQEYYNKNSSDEKKISFIIDSEEGYKALKSKTGKELESISRYLEDSLEKMKQTVSDRTNLLFLEGHLHTMIMSVFIELTRTDCRGKERLAQATRSH